MLRMFSLIEGEDRCMESIYVWSIPKGKVDDDLYIKVSTKGYNNPFIKQNRIL